ncbi:MAG: hypothetical protein JW925_08650 [Syntrophaceae bacterium]|nr:hypothetical protein [Syntrophaceae bacterium]
MLRTILNNKGITIVESLVAVMLTGLAVLGLLAMQPLSLTAAGKADSLTRATELMHSELQVAECTIMSGSTPTNMSNEPVTVGNQTFYVTRTTTVRDTVSWLVRINVNWGGNSRGVSSSLIVSRQSAFM